MSSRATSGIFLFFFFLPPEPPGQGFSTANPPRFKSLEIKMGLEFLFHPAFLGMGYCLGRKQNFEMNFSLITFTTQESPWGRFSISCGFKVTGIWEYNPKYNLWKFLRMRFKDFSVCGSFKIIWEVNFSQMFPAGIIILNI